MIKNLVPVALIAAVTIGASSCQNNSGFKKTKDGLEYKIIKDAPGKPAQMGDVVEVNIVFKVGKNNGTSKDSVIVDSRKENGGKPVTMPVREGRYKGDFVGGLNLLSAGDSAVFRISYDSVKAAMKGQPMPPFGKPGDYFIYEITMVSQKSKADYQKEMEDKSKAQAATDDKVLQDYFAKNNIKAQKTQSGLYYTIQKEGSGELPAKGQTVSVMYTGKLLDGTTFDSNVGKDAMKVRVGGMSTIPGFDEGLMLLKKGSKATLFMPSVLAYGSHATGPIPADACLIFEVEVTDIK